MIKYQIFVSSTYEDLKAERDQVIKAILEMGHIPVGMEMFSAADEEQWEIIKRQIDQSDYYVVIIAHRYGSTTGGRSYTEKEYDYAISKKVPILGFIIDESAAWPKAKMEDAPKKSESLEQFKSKVKAKPVGFWNTLDDLHGKVSIALMKAMTANPRIGWVRASEVAGPEVTREISRLSSENSQLRAKVEELQDKHERDEIREYIGIIKTLSNNDISMRVWKKYGSEWEGYKSSNLYRFFSVVAPELFNEEHTEALAYSVAHILHGTSPEHLREVWPIPKNSILLWLADLSALGLVEPSIRKRSVKDNKDYWTLTPKGRAVHALVRKANLEKSESSELASQMDDSPENKGEPDDVEPVDSSEA